MSVFSSIEKKLWYQLLEVCIYIFLPVKAQLNLLWLMCVLLYYALKLPLRGVSCLLENAKLRSTFFVGKIVFLCQWGKRGYKNCVRLQLKDVLAKVRWKNGPRSLCGILGCRWECLCAMLWSLSCDRDGGRSDFWPSGRLKSMKSEWTPTPPPPHGKKRVGEGAKGGSGGGNRLNMGMLG